MRNQNQVRKDGSKKAARGQSGKPESGKGRNGRAFLAEPGRGKAGHQALALLKFPASLVNHVLEEKRQQKIPVLEWMRQAVLDKLGKPLPASAQVVQLLNLDDAQAAMVTEQAHLRNITHLELLQQAVRSALETPQRLDGLWETMEEVNQYVTECRTLLHIYGERYFEAVEYPGDKRVADGLASMGGCAGDSLGNAVDIAWQHVRSLGERAKATKARAAEAAAAKGGEK